MIEDLNDKFPEKAFINPVDNPVIEHWSHKRCGSYTSEWIARAMGMKPDESNTVLSGPVWFDLFRPILPGDMRELFRFDRMTGIEVKLDHLTDEEKLNWIKREVSLKKRPPALLIRTTTLHWIAVGGYDDTKRLFYIYDARYGANSLDLDLPIGNFTMSYNELLHRWRGRWFLQYVAIVIVSLHAKRPLI